VWCGLTLRTDWLVGAVGAISPTACVCVWGVLSAHRIRMFPCAATIVKTRLTPSSVFRGPFSFKHYRRRAQAMRVCPRERSWSLL